MNSEYISKHIKRKDNVRESMFNAYWHAILKTASVLNLSVDQLKLCDIGCGRGEFLKYAH